MSAVLFTLCAASATTLVGPPRSEHPRPDWRRPEWTSLNGLWQFAETDDNGDQSWLGDKDFPDTVSVPFCRESALSGLGRRGFVKNVWYKRSFRRPEHWLSARTVLHIGASDWRTMVWLNGRKVGTHTGGSAPIDMDVTDSLKAGDNTLIVHVFDDTRSGVQALGKQCPELNSYGCLYTRTTGIWQSVWLEGVGASSVSQAHLRTSDPKTGRVKYDLTLSRAEVGQRVVAEIFEGSTAVAAKSFPVDSGGRAVVDLRVPRPRSWEPGRAFLYPVRFTVFGKDGKALESVDTYVGLRDIKVDGRAILINGKRVFQRLVLDQGFYPDGVWTAPSDAALKRDIELSMAAGFNGARLHEKVFEPRFLYWADKLGYLVWGEFPNWGLDYKKKEIERPVTDEWKEIVVRDRNHPSIVGWCPFNETPGEAVWLQNPIVAMTKTLDPTRPVIDSSGYAHGLPEPEVLDAHDYDQNPVTFKQRWDSAVGSSGLPARYGSGTGKGVPFMVSEYGGIGWATGAGWGYGDSPKSMGQFYARFKGLSDALLDNRNMFGFCYTQLTDVEQERNGVYTFDRKPKFDVKWLHRILSRPAAIEKQGPDVGPSQDDWKVLVRSARDEGGTAWKSTTEKPPADWAGRSFADASWYVSPGGFGSKGGFEKDIVTAWTTPDIWLRQAFKAPSSKVNKALLVVHYDNAAEVYVNGKRVWASARGAWNDGYQGFDVTDAVKGALRTGGNLIAVHCHQDTGGQFIDLALLVR
ncbi:MAG: beta-galactosidase [Armatimonadetes bacterium]|nr:beta-galactosidase [Armatimonadota bacterium]